MENENAPFQKGDIAYIYGPAGHKPHFPYHNWDMVEIKVVFKSSECDSGWMVGIQKYPSGFWQMNLDSSWISPIPEFVVEEK